MAKQTPTSHELNNVLPMPQVINEIIYEYIGNPFIFTLNIDMLNTIITIPIIESTNGFYIEWGDNIKNYYIKDKEKIKHKYRHAGKYIIYLYGDITKILFEKVTELIEISQWGNLRLLHGGKIFSLCKNLIITARDSINLTYTKSLAFMFQGCTSLTADLSKWDVSNIGNFCGMFNGCEKFNSDLSKWNVSNATTMYDMFYRCSSFNSDISNWDVSNVVYMNYMFVDCKLFNADLSKWDIGNVAYASYMFADCKSFNADLSKWNTRKVKDMSKMFYGCSLFNCDLSNWNISNVKCIDGIFYKCDSFKSDLTKWNIKDKSIVYKID